MAEATMEAAWAAQGGLGSPTILWVRKTGRARQNQQNKGSNGTLKSCRHPHSEAAAEQQQHYHHHHHHLTRNKLIRGLRRSSSPDLLDSLPAHTAVPTATVAATVARGCCRAVRATVAPLAAAADTSWAA